MEDEEFLTEELVAEVMAQFTWPATFQLEEDAFGVMVNFPRCSFRLSQGVGGTIVLTFLEKDTQYLYPLKLGHALMAVFPESERDGGPIAPGLINDPSIYPSEEKVRNYLHDICQILHFHLQPCLLGDFSWVEKFKELERNRLENK